MYTNDYHRENLEKYRRFLEREVEAGWSLIDSFEKESRWEEVKEWRYKTTSAEIALKKFNELFPKPEYLPRWVRYAAWVLMLIVCSLLIAICLAQK